jgi:hypothetical protein
VRVHLQGTKNSFEAPNIYIVYDRPHRVTDEDDDVKHLWMSWQYPPEDTGPVWFYSEEEALDWIDTRQITGEWVSHTSELYVIKLPKLISTEVLLSDDPKAKLVVLVNAANIEELWTNQYEGS